MLVRHERGVAESCVTFMWLSPQDIDRAIALTLQDDELELVGRGVSMGLYQTTIDMSLTCRCDSATTTL